MKKRSSLVLILIALAITGCQNSTNSNSQSSTVTEPDTREFHVYDINETIFLNGLLNQRYYDLTKMYIHLDDEVITADNFEFSGGDNAVSEKNGNQLVYKKTGVSKFNLASGSTNLSLLLTVNDSEETRGLYSTVDFNNFFDEWVVQKGNNNSFVEDVTNQTLRVNASGTEALANLILDEHFRKNIHLEFDFDFTSTISSSATYGVVFRQQIPIAYPYYQLNIKRDLTETAGISLLEYTEEGRYNLLGVGSYDKTLLANTSMKMAIKIENYSFTLLIDGEVAYQTTLHNVLPGHIGFHSTATAYGIRNLKLYSPDTVLTASNQDNKYFVTRTPVTANTFMNLSVSYETIAETTEKLNDQYVVSSFIKVVHEDNNLIAYSKSGQKLVDLYSYMSLVKGKLMPIMQVDSIEVATLLANMANSYGFIDIVVLSHDSEVLKTFKSLSPLNKVGYLTENDNLPLDSKELAQVCLKVGVAKGNILVVPTDKLNRDFIYKANIRGYIVWAISHDDSRVSAITAAVSGANLLISSNYDNTISTTTFSSDSLFKIPVITGHRGDGSGVNYPENSLESFLWAVENGAQAVEIDIHTTSDGKLVVMHDETTTRTSSCSLTIKSSTLNSLMECNLKYGNGNTSEYTIPSFEDVLKAFEDLDKIIVVEIKDNLASTAKLAIDLINQYDMADQIVMIGFNVSPMLESKTTAPLISTGYLGGVNVKTEVDYVSMNELFNSYGMGLSPNMGYLSTLGMQYSNLRGNIYWIWTFNNSMGDFNTHLKNGNICFTTNYVTLTKNVNFRLEASEDSYTLTSGNTLTITGNLYDMNQVETTTNNVSIQVIEGNDLVSINNNTLTANRSGEVYLLLSYKTQLNTSIAYTIYSQVVKVTIQ